MGGFVRTVLGDFPSAGIEGHVLVHEHVNFDTSRIKRDPDARMSEPATIVEELERFKRAGGEVLVDLSPPDNGREASVLNFIASNTQVQIVCSTGYYFGLYLPLRAINRSVEALAQEFISDITEGIEGGPIRAGIIGEIGTSIEPLPAELRVFQAAVQAQLATGVAIVTHTHFGTNALEQIKLLEKFGGDLEKIAIGHMDLYPDPEIHLEVAKRGAYVCLDNAGRLDYRPDEERIEMVRYLFDKGFGERVIISSDTSRKSHLHKYGGHGYDYVSNSFLPALRACGFSDEELKLLIHENPLRLISIGTR